MNRPRLLAATPHRGDMHLAELVVRRDPEALTTFATRMECVPRFLATLNRRLGNPVSMDEIADLAQDSVIQVMGSMSRYEGRASLETWAWHACRGALLNRVRSIQRAPKVSTLDFDVASPERQLMIDSEELHSALEDLGPPEEDVIRLKLNEGLRFKEVGERLDISPNTAKTQYYRGIRWLQERLAPHRREDAS